MKRAVCHERTVWDQEFFRRRAAGPAQEPAAVTLPAPEHATIAGLLLARADDDNTALLFEDPRWSWRELVREAAALEADYARHGRDHLLRL
jgi:hypothetical protein